MKISCENYTFIPYVLDGGSCLITTATKETSENKLSLMLRLKKLLQDVEIQSK